MSSKTQTRGSCPKVSSRPKLMRAHATAPSLATGNASRKDLASLQSSSRATTILTRVASYSAQQDHTSPRSSPSSSCSSPLSRSPENTSSLRTFNDLKNMKYEFFQALKTFKDTKSPVNEWSETGRASDRNFEMLYL
ncbi:heterogeneous nuclear ribonucleo g protein [Rutstroemia sp. NJR-2017a WRK4]|nr:hypothetical protein CJF30_00003269 [Rutstroemia sp. NJR-2017a BBW]PQE30772.1 heterogeneous nuclear ribonucleo g protein [Rutstroemia sp. NJR-2017a WRK4]